MPDFINVQPPGVSGSVDLSLRLAVEAGYVAVHPELGAGKLRLRHSQAEVVGVVRYKELKTRRDNKEYLDPYSLPY